MDSTAFVCLKKLLLVAVTLTAIGTARRAYGQPLFRLDEKLRATVVIPPIPASCAQTVGGWPPCFVEGTIQFLPKSFVKEAVYHVDLRDLDTNEKIDCVQIRQLTSLQIRACFVVTPRRDRARRLLLTLRERPRNVSWQDYYGTLRTQTKGDIGAIDNGRFEYHVAPFAPQLPMFTFPCFPQLRTPIRPDDNLGIARSFSTRLHRFDQWNLRDYHHTAVLETFRDAEMLSLRQTVASTINTDALDWELTFRCPEITCRTRNETFRLRAGELGGRELPLLPIWGQKGAVRAIEIDLPESDMLLGIFPMAPESWGRLWHQSADSLNRTPVTLKPGETIHDAAKITFPYVGVQRTFGLGVYPRDRFRTWFNKLPASDQKRESAKQWVEKLDQWYGMYSLSWLMQCKFEQDLPDNNDLSKSLGGRLAETSEFGLRTTPDGALHGLDASITTMATHELGEAQRRKVARCLQENAYLYLLHEVPMREFPFLVDPASVARRQRAVTAILSIFPQHPDSDKWRTDSAQVARVLGDRLILHSNDSPTEPGAWNPVHANSYYQILRDMTDAACWAHSGAEFQTLSELWCDHADWLVHASTPPVTLDATKDVRQTPYLAADLGNHIDLVRLADAIRGYNPQAAERLEWLVGQGGLVPDGWLQTFPDTPRPLTLQAYRQEATARFAPHVRGESVKRLTNAPLGICPDLRSRSFWGWGHVLRRQEDDQPETVVQLQQPSLESVAASKRAGAIEYYAGGKLFSSDPRFTSENAAPCIARVAVEDSPVKDGYRTIGPAATYEPVVDFGFSKFAEIIANESEHGAYPAFNSRSCWLVGDDYCAIYDHVRMGTLQFDWCNPTMADAPVVFHSGTPRMMSEISTDNGTQLRRWKSSGSDGLTIVTHRQDLGIRSLLGRRGVAKKVPPTDGPAAAIGVRVRSNRFTDYVFQNHGAPESSHIHSELERIYKIPSRYRVAEEIDFDDGQVEFAGRAGLVRLLERESQHQLGIIRGKRVATEALSISINQSTTAIGGIARFAPDRNEVRLKIVAAEPTRIELDFTPRERCLWDLGFLRSHHFYLNGRELSTTMTDTVLEVEVAAGTHDLEIVPGLGSPHRPQILSVGVGIDRAVVSWKRCMGAETFAIELSTDAGRSFRRVALTSRRAYSIGQLVEGRKYHVRIVGRNLDREGPVSLPVTFRPTRVLASAPRALHLVKFLDEHAYLRWGQIAGAQSYRLQRRTFSEDENWETIYFGADTEYVDFNVNRNGFNPRRFVLPKIRYAKARQYRVSAVNLNGESVPGRAIVGDYSDGIPLLTP